MNRRMRSFSLILSLFIAIPSFGKPVLLAPPSVSPDEFEAALMSDPDRLSYIDHYLTTTPPSRAVEELAHRFSQAEQSFIHAAQLEEALREYRKVIELEMTEDWNEDQRRLFLITYLRLLQITQTHESPERQKWIERSLFYLRHTEAPRDLIPPPVLRELEMKGSLNPLTEVSIPKNISQTHPKVLVQGKLYDTHQPIPVGALEADLRWTFLSDFFEPETVVASPLKIKSFKLATKAFVSGECNQSFLKSGKIKQVLVKIYKPLHCETSEEKPKEITLPQSIPKPSTQWKMTKKHWLWIGAGAVAAAVIASQLQQGSKTKEPTPTETYGF